MRKSMITMFLMLILATPSAFAQTGGAFYDFSPNFFLAILAGVVLAFGFQAVLTLLSVAIGINVAGPFNKNRRKTKNDSHDETDQDDKTPLSVKISSAAGIWALITMSLSLFFASWFGVKLSLFQNNVIGMTLGLVIWAAFFLIMMYLEVRSISSIAGGFFNMVSGALSASAGAVRSVFQKSKEDKMIDLVDHSVDKIRHELFSRFDTDVITEKLDQYVGQLKPEPIDYNRLEEELKQILNEIEIEHRMEPGEGSFDRRTFIRIAEESPRMTKEDIKKVGDMYDRVKTAASKGETKTQKLASVIDTITPGSPSDTAEFRNNLSDYLRRTEAEEIQPEKLEQDLEQILSHPNAAKEVIMNRVNQLDRNTLIQLIKSSSDKIDDEKADRIVGTAESVLRKIRSSIAGASETARSKSGDGANFAGDTATKMKQGVKNKRLEWEMRLRELFESFQRPEYDYDRIKADMIRMFKDPSLAPEIISLKLKDYDKETLMELLSRNKYLDKKDIENFISKFEDARSTIVNRYEEVELQVRQKVHEAKQAALDRAETMRKTAAVASWWLVGAAVISAVASLLGGMLAI